MTQDFIKTELAKYNLPDAAIAKMKADYLPLKVKAIDDVENYMVCKEAYKVVSKIRIDIEKKRKELKASSLDFGRSVDTEAKRLTAGVQEVENHLMAQRKVVEDEKKRREEEIERKEREEQDRVRREEEERIEAVRKEQEAKEKALEEEREKIEADKRANEAEKQRLIDEKAQAERLKKEAEEAKKKAEQDEKDRTEREKRHAEEVEKAKKEAAEQAKREEKERIEREAREKEEKAEAERVKVEKAKLLAPDKEKIFAYRSNLNLVAVPQLKTSEGMTIIAKAVHLVSDVLDYLDSEAGKL